ncbi:pyridoxamine 5'-phosphate oxidase family protein [Nocardioides sp. KR10-350]|uniref:pyridoxamine 5'-phosphate oxidase family protein n=1 Tax=Nocardioides cheoyonin TaxID=3156615 RepID=UPI0032B55817
MAHLEELSVDECWKLAAGSGLARIGWTGPAGPVVLPVNHVVHEGTVWIRTSAHSSMAEEIDESNVAVLVDDLDPATHLGWSVQFRGHADVLYREEQVPEHVRALHSWPSGPRPLWVRLTPKDVNGRRLVAD